MIKRSAFVDWLANDVKNPSEGFFANGNSDHVTGVAHLQAARETFRTIHGDTTNRILPEVLGDLKNEIPLLIADRSVGHL